MARSLASRKAKICHEVPGRRRRDYARKVLLQGDFTVRTFLVLAFSLWLTAAQARDVNVPQAKPESVGFSSVSLVSAFSPVVGVGSGVGAGDCACAT